MIDEKTLFVAGDDSGDFNVSSDSATSHNIINKAIQYAATNGYTTVHLKGPFTYWIDSTINMVSNLKLTGDRSAVLKLVDKAGWKVSVPLIGPTSAVLENVEICGFTIDGNHDGNYDDSRGKNQIFPCVNKGIGYYNLICFKNSNNINVHNMTLQNGHGDGLRVENCKFVTFAYNNVSLLGHDAVYFLSCADCESAYNSVLIRTNSGSRANDCIRTKIHHNKMKALDRWDAGNPGIQVERMYLPAIDVEVFENDIYDTYGCAIWLIRNAKVAESGKSSVKIHHNRIVRCGHNPTIEYVGGIINTAIQGVVVENNIIVGCYGHGIACMSIRDANTSPDTGIRMYVKNNIIIDTVKRAYNGLNTGVGIQNKFGSSHTIIAQYNDVWDNAGGDYAGVTPSNSISADPLFVDGANHDYHLQSIAGHWTGDGYQKDIVSSPCLFGDEVEMGCYGGTAEASLKPAVYQAGDIQNNRLKSNVKTPIYTSAFVDVGELNGIKYRDLIWADLSEFTENDITVTSARILLYWYHPAGQVRTEDTIVEIYRPVEWNTKSVTWLNRTATEKWNIPGGDWLDVNGVVNGNSPFASLTFKKGTVPTNAYYGFDVTDLVQKYIDGTYPNTGFLIKAKTEKSNYIAFYSINTLATNKKMKLKIEYQTARVEGDLPV